MVTGVGCFAFGLSGENMLHKEQCIYNPVNIACGPCAVRRDQPAHVCHKLLQGLVRLDAHTRNVTVVTSRVSLGGGRGAGTPIDFANDVAVKSNGMVYFSESANGIVPAKGPDGVYDALGAASLVLWQASNADMTCSSCPACALRPWASMQHFNLQRQPQLYLSIM